MDRQPQICLNGTTPRWPVSGPLDFDCDGKITSPVIANINGDAANTPLPGFDDWAHLDFTGGGIGLLGAPAPPTVTNDDEPPISELIADAQAIKPQAIKPTTAAPTTTPAPTTPAPVPPKPRAAKLVLSHLRIHPARVKRTATISYRLSTAGKVRFTLTPCRAHCTFIRSGHAGTNTFRLRIRGLKPGRHRLRAQPVQNGAKRTTVAFRVQR